MSEKKQNLLEKLGEANKFVIVKDDKNKDIDHIIFEDGRQYKLQHPTFMRLHEVMFSADNTDHVLLTFGLTVLYPENEKSPKITEEYLNLHRDDGLYLWSPLIRGLLSAG